MKKSFSNPALLLSRLTLFALAIVLFQSCKKENTQPTVPSSSISAVPVKNRVSYFISLNNFIYYSQLTSGPSYTYRYNGCAAASCLMAAHLMLPNLPANMSVLPPNVNSTVFTAFCSGMVVTSGGTSISNAYSYLKNTYYSNQIAPYGQSGTTTGRNNTITKMKTYLSGNYPVIAIIQYNATTKLPTTGSGVGHFVVVVGLNETTAGNGTVYYYDPYGNPGLKSYSFSGFLNCMKSIQSGNYNIMRVGN